MNINEDFLKIRFQEQLEIMFEQRPEWDTKEDYCVEKLKIFFESAVKGDTLHEINAGLTLRKILSDARMHVKHGLPTFVVLSIASQFFNEYQKRNTFE